MDNGYEILIGHNRWNASKIAGLSTVPCIIKEGLSEDEAETYVIESNVMQRGFDNLKISEQAAVIALQHSKMFSPGKRNDILRELALLENPNAETLTPLESRLDTSREIGREYNKSKGTVIRLIRIDKLVDPLKTYVDNGTLAVRSAVELSFLSNDTQTVIAELLEDHKLDMKKAKMLRDTADENGDIDSGEVIRIITGEKNVSEKAKTVKLRSDIYSKYFKPTAKPDEIAETVEKALEFYFENMK